LTIFRARQRSTIFADVGAFMRALVQERVRGLLGPGPLPTNRK
jgi:hypothetical protein